MRMGSDFPILNARSAPLVLIVMETVRLLVEQTKCTPTSNVPVLMVLAWIGVVVVCCVRMLLGDF